MREHLSKDELAGSAGRTLPADKLVEADSHLSGCAECRGQLRMPLSARRLPEASHGVSHLEYEQMTAYLDERLDEPARDAVDRHVQSCSLCETELRDLEAFDKAMALEPERQETKFSVWQSLLALLRKPYLLPVSAVLVLVVAGMLGFRSGTGAGRTLSYAADRPAPATMTLLFGLFLAAATIGAFLLKKYSKK
jgi:hypothetical protein